jgi:LuxR family maltose regulon positive regulatory protein
MAAERLRQASAYMSKTYRFGAALNYLSLAGSYLHMQGRLHEAWQVFQEAIGRGTGPTGLPSVEVGVAYMHQAHILHEWNQLDAALTLVQQGLDLTEQAGYNLYLARGYIVLTRIYLSQEAWDAADAALQRALQLPAFVGNPYQQAWLVAIEQVRLWIGRGALDRAMGWAATLEHSERPTSLFAREREQVALARIDLAQQQPAQALARLEPQFASATATERWDHVIEMRLLQALAQERRQSRHAALAALAEAVRLGEQAGFVRRFVDEGPLVAALLGALHDQQRQHGPTPYLDNLLAAFSI